MINSAAIRNLFTLPFLIWAILFIFCPLVAIAWYGLTDSSGTFTLANISLIAHWEYLKSLELSLLLALVSTVVCLLVAYPLCLILTEEKRSKSTLLFLLFVLPVLILLIGVKAAKTWMRIKVRGIATSSPSPKLLPVHQETVPNQYVTPEPVGKPVAEDARTK